jgi:DeoR/GlpR family transcriptional regulator of sugar metabolism
LSEINVDLCFLGANGLSPENGITDSDIEVIQVKKSMIKTANKLIVLTISEKLSSEQRMTVCAINQINTLITELAPQSKELTPYHDLGINIL